MRPERSLRGRIVATFALLTLIVCAFFAGMVFFSLHEIEKKLIQDRLSAAADWLIARRDRGAPADSPLGIRLVHGHDVPVEMATLAPGFHELTVGRDTVHVIVRTRDGERFVAIDDANDFERIELEIFIGLTVGLALCAMLAVLLGRMTASRIIAPVTALAEAVEKDALNDGTPSNAAKDEIGVLARAFAARTAELQRFLIRERLFTGDVSHELRSPLNVILGAAELIAVRAVDQPDLAAAAERIQRTAAETAERVSALLLLSRSPEVLDAPRIALQPLIEREIERCRPLTSGKPVNLRFDSGNNVHVFARAELAAMAIGNLLRNACQYTECGEVVIHLTREAIVVEDTGPGLPESLRERVFERFVRGSADGTGSGMGLAIVKRVAEHLGWTLRLENRTGGGTRFILEFAAA